MKAISPKIMMEEHFYALYVFTVQSNGGVVTPPYLSTLKTYPTPGEGPINSGGASINFFLCGGGARQNFRGAFSPAHPPGAATAYTPRFLHQNDRKGCPGSY